jgi:hypothetical protein
MKFVYKKIEKKQTGFIKGVGTHVNIMEIIKKFNK